MKKRWLLGGVALLTLFLGACGKTEETASDKLRMVTTFYPVYEFTKEIVGEDATVELLLPSGIEVHDYEPSAKDIVNITDADVFIYHHPGLETWVPEITKNLDTDKTQLIEATKGMQLMTYAEEEHDEHEEHEGHTHEAGEEDVHVWLSPKKAQEEVATIRDQLIAVYPEKKEQWTKNATAYLEKLEKLDKQYETTLKDAKQRIFITQHGAFGYLAQAYQLEQHAIAGLSAEQEPTPSRLAELKDFASEHGLAVIYFETNTSEKIAQTLAKEAKVELEVLQTLESLTDQQRADGLNYIQVMEQNLKALQKSIH